MTFPKTLETLLQERNMQTVHLAAAMADRGSTVYLQTIDRWLDGSSEPRAQHLRCIADVLGVTLDDLYPSGNAPQEVTP